MDHPRWINKQVSILATQLGFDVKPERLVLYAEALADIPRAKLEPAFLRLSREWNAPSFPQVATIREYALGKLETESLGAWEEAISFCGKYVGNDPFGNFGPEHGWHKSWPRLTDRVLQTVRMTGGWRSLKLMDDGDEPFVRRRFLEAYEYALDVIALPPGVLSLPALPAPKKFPKPVSKPAPPTIEQVAKPFYNPISNEEWNRRKQEQIEQAKKIRKKYNDQKKADE